MARDIYVSSLHTLIKPILYELSGKQDVTENMIGFDEVILLSHDDEKVHFMGVRRNDGVFDSVDYMTITAEEFWDTMNGIEYICKGFIDLDSIQAKYLFAGVWEETVVEAEEEEGMECDKAYNSVMNLIDQLEDTKKQEKYKSVFSDFFVDFAHNRGV
jgi:hypothetical protein